MWKKSFYFLKLFTRFIHLYHWTPTKNTTTTRYINQKMARRQTQVSANNKCATICLNLQQKKLLVRRHK
jgi:hypothetical protein